MLSDDTPEPQLKSSIMDDSHIAPSIQAISPFSPKEWKCLRCNSLNSLTSSNCSSSKCDGRLALRGASLLDYRGQAVNPAPFPVHWLCSTCDTIHLVLDILTARVNCVCGSPTLRAVYDQFGDIFLLWRDDAAVHNLSRAEMVQEAAWRLWEAGAGPWLAEVVAADENVAAPKGGLTGQNHWVFRGWRIADAVTAMGLTVQPALWFALTRTVTSVSAMLLPWYQRWGTM